MRRILTSSLLMVFFLLTGSLVAEGATVRAGLLTSLKNSTRQKAEGFTGKEIVARIYGNRPEQPGAFRKTTLKAGRHTVKFDIDDANDPAFVAVWGEDQKDEAIGQLFDGHIYGWAYEEGLEFYLPTRAPDINEEEYWWTFSDALGNPVSNVIVDVYLKHNRRQIPVFQGTTDNQARLILPFSLADERAFVRRSRVQMGRGTPYLSFVVLRAGYNVAVVNVVPETRHYHDNTIVVPAVPPGTEADSRSIWGVVLDSDNIPVSGLLIEATGVYPLGAGYVGSIPRQSPQVITDEHGRFRLYLPPTKNGEKMGTLIPPKSEYYVMIKPPQALGLLPFSGRIPNGLETKITLEHAGSFRTFAFEDENGPINDPNRLEQITFSIERPGKDILGYRYRDFKAGGMFPLGTYEAKIDRRQGYKFKPIEVTADSPEQLVFKPSMSKLYYGQVVHGITGKPMAGAFVIDMEGSSSKNLSMCSPEQWDALHDLPRNPLPDNKTVVKFDSDNCFSFVNLVRTGDFGRFEMTIPTNRVFYQLVVFQKDYLTVFVPRELLKTNDDGNVEAPLTRLFPAATAIVEPWIDEQHKSSVAVYPKWTPDPTDNPDWLQDFLACCPKQRHRGVREAYSLRPDGLQSFYVPAGLNLRVTLYTPYNNEYSPLTVTECINLQQGQVLYLGRQVLQVSVKILVRVTDSMGSHVEGVPVAARSVRYGAVTHTTDEKGIVRFDMAQHSQGQFVVEYDGGDEPNAVHVREAIPYEIAGPEDANGVYTLHVSDEMLYRLFK